MKRFIPLNTKITLSVLCFTAAVASAKMPSTLEANRVFIKHGLIQQNSVSGSIKDTNGMPVKGAKVFNKTKNIEVFTDDAGHFTIPAVVNDVIEISVDNIIFHTQNVTDYQEISITYLPVQKQEREGNKDIEEIVITGYQRIEPNKAAASYNVVDMKSFEKRGTPDVVSALEGLSPALVLSTNPADPSGSKELTIRGVSTLAGSSAPLIVVDGFQYEGDLRSINPYEVENITLTRSAL